MPPLFFQVDLLDSATKADALLAIPSPATPIGSLISGIVMSRWGKLIPLIQLGAVLPTIGNGLVTSLSFYDSKWKYLVFIFPVNLGQGVIYPAILFITLVSFDHADHAVSASTVYLIRSLGSVWGVDMTATIVQNTLTWRLSYGLTRIPNKKQLIEEIRHSVIALRHLPPDLQYKPGLCIIMVSDTTSLLPLPLLL